MEASPWPQDSREQRLASMAAQYQPLLLKICYAYLCDGELARDAVQETFLKAYQAMDGFRGECSEKNWLIQIARNTCRDMRRSGWFCHVDRKITPEDLPEAAYSVPEQERELTAAILRLPEKLKDVVLLYYYQNFSVTEAAEMLHITQPSVSSRLIRARRKLKALLEKGDAK